MARRRPQTSDTTNEKQKQYPDYDDFLYDDLQEDNQVERSDPFQDKKTSGEGRNRVAPMQQRRKRRWYDVLARDVDPSEEEEDTFEEVHDTTSDDGDSESDTPEEALAKLSRSQEARAPKARKKPVKKSAEDEDDIADDASDRTSDDDAEETESTEDDEEAIKRAEKASRFARKQKRERTVRAGAEEKKKLRARRRLGVIVITILITAVLGCMFFARVTGYDILSTPENGISTVLTPVQSLFSSIVDSVVDYLQTLKVRANLETEYNNLRAENEELTYQAMLVEELQTQLSQYEDMYDEVSANSNMNPIVCQVIDRSDTNYFATFVINKGSRDGIEDYMAVTMSGALVGYTENVKESTSTVRCIIDSEASIAALIQSSRDQGTIKGTLGVDGTYLCRMYYLSEDHLPRPGDTVVTSGVGMSFPKGIPIGTVRESTRGMESNKQYIVVEPLVDFEHIEYVIVLRYQPAAEAVTGRESSSVTSDFVALETARPYPTLRISSSNFVTAAPAEADTEEEEVTPSPTPTETPSPTPAPTDTPKPTETVPVYEYQLVSSGPTATPTASPTPSPTPYITLNPGDMTYEEDD